MMNAAILRFAWTLALCQPLTGWAHHAPGHDEAPPAPSREASAASAPAPGMPVAMDKAALRWTEQPLILPAEQAMGERANVRLKTERIAATALTVFAPEGPPERRKVDYPLGPDGARIASATPKIGNYHWVIAREETSEAVRVASTAWYFGNPGDSPKNLLLEAKHELEIVPQPLPREHSAYREAEKWRFLVRFKGAPLPHQPLLLETEHGSRSTVFTDAAGVASVLFPRDFKPATDAAHAGHGPRRASFVLSTVWQADGRRFETAFNHFYAPDPERNRSLGWGALFGLIGMLAATPLLQRRRNGGTDHA